MSPIAVVAWFVWTACPPGKHGFACLQDCRCSENSNCDHVTGDCICKPGHTGIDCARGSLASYSSLYTNNNNNKLSKNFDKRPHRRLVTSDTCHTNNNNNKLSKNFDKRPHRRLVTSRVTNGFIRP